MAKIVWEFTNQRKLTKSEFVDYFERKVFRTIRKYSMLPSDKIVRLKKLDDLNTNVLVAILRKKFQVEFGSRPNFSSENLSVVAENFFKNVLKGKFEGDSPSGKVARPLYFLSDKEVELYAKLVGIDGKKRKVAEKIQSLFSRFLEKNQDLEVNVVKAISQLD